MRSIRRQLTRDLLAAMTALLIAGVAVIYFAVRDEAFDQFDAALRAKALAISAITERTSSGVRVDITDRFFRSFDDRKPRDFFVIWDERDRTVARSESLRRGRELPRRVGKFDRPEKWNLTLPNGQPGRALGFRFKPKGTGSGDAELQLVVASDREELDETLWQLLAISAGCGVLLAAGTAWLIPRVLRRGLKPLDALSDEVTRIDAESLGRRVRGADLPAELRPIAGRLNELLERLEASFERERRFSADLAHELRTPLAELRSVAECALKWPETRHAATDRETLAIAEHMEAIVTHILALARGEQGQLAVDLQVVALEPLVREVWGRFAPRAAERGLSVALSLAPLRTDADPALLRSILANLFENAVTYTPAGGAIAFTLEQDAHGGPAVFRIANTISDLEPADVPKLFDRFWRKEAARSGGVHVGLGLSLARTFAAAMGWTLTAALDDEHRLGFTLRAKPAASGSV